MAALPLQSQISQTSTFSKAYRARVMRLGDGYSQRVQDGINAAYWTGRVEYIPLTQTDLNTLTAFIDGIGSWGTFDYQPTGAPAVCKFSVDPAGLSISTDGVYYTVSFQCRQEFDL